MFNIGDKIVYPTQGVGVLKGIEEKEFFGEKQQYHKIELINNGMEIMIPTARIPQSNLRLISDGETVDQCLSNFNKESEAINEQVKNNSRDRISANTIKLKSGQLADYMDVFSSLAQINSVKALNINEKQMLLNARKFLVDEISLSKNIGTDEASKLIENYIE